MISGNASKGKPITGSPLSPNRFKSEKRKSMGVRRMRGLQLTKEQLEELYWKRELSLDQIEEKLGCSRTKVYYWLKKFGIKRRAEYKKHLKIEKDVLEDLYWKQKLSMIEIGKRFGCENSNILYWMKKYRIETRPIGFNEIVIPKETIQELYWEKKMTASQIGKKFGTNHKRVLKKMRKAGIPSRTLSEAVTKKFKRPFTGDLSERAYLLGLRTGDFHAKQQHISVRMQTTSTHPAQVELLRNSLKKYGETKTYYSRNKAREDEWFIYTDLDKSFEFLLKKLDEIPQWILENEDCFYSFLCAYSDCEASFSIIKSHQNSSRFIFRITAGDKKVLEQIKSSLESYGYNPCFYLKSTKGKQGTFGTFNLDMYSFIMYRKEETLRLIKNLLPHSKHQEKIDKMEYIQANKDKNWKQIIGGWDKIREGIKAGLLKNCSQD
jgi:transposase-like protein